MVDMADASDVFRDEHPLRKYFFKVTFRYEYLFHMNYIIMDMLGSFCIYLRIQNVERKEYHPLKLLDASNVIEE